MSPENSDGPRAGPAREAASAACHKEEAIGRARIERLRASMPGRKSILEELIALFLADLPRRLGAIEHAIAHADCAALVLNAHALRGGAANFGAASLDELCGRLEDAGACGALEAAPPLLAAIQCESARVREALAALRFTPADVSTNEPGATTEAVQKSSGISR